MIKDTLLQAWRNRSPESLRSMILKKLVNRIDTISREITELENKDKELREKVMAAMEILGTTQEEFPRVYALIYDRGGKVDYATAREHLDTDTLEEVTEMKVDMKKVRELLGDRIHEVMIPTISVSKFRKKVADTMLITNSEKILKIEPVRRKN